MFIKTWEDRRGDDHWAWKPWFGVLLLIIIPILCSIVGAQRLVIRDKRAELALYEVAMPKWKEFEAEKTEQVAKLKKERDELTVKYEALQCSTRGLVVTTVKGITLCMNPDNKALHKIDEKAD